MGVIYKNGIPYGGGGSGGSGHTIEDQAGTEYAQESILQFLDSQITDDSTNGKTKVEIIKTISQQDFDNLGNNTDGIYIVDAPDYDTYSVLAANWTANTDVTTSTDYPYIYTISEAGKYSLTSKPIWDLDGAGAIPTSTERESINMILEAVFSNTGIILYATDEPQENLTLVVKGV